MNEYEKIYRVIITEGRYKNVAFSDLRYLLEHTGFKFRNKGDSHYKYSMEGIPEIINIQPQPGDAKTAKPYQVKQVQKIFKKYKIGGKDDEQ